MFCCSGNVYIGGEYDMKTGNVKSDSQLKGAITGFALANVTLPPTTIRKITSDTGSPNSDFRSNWMMYDTIGGSNLIQTMANWEIRPGIIKTNSTSKCTGQCKASLSGNLFYSNFLSWIMINYSNYLWRSLVTVEVKGMGQSTKVGQLQSPFIWCLHIPCWITVLGSRHCCINKTNFTHFQQI